ncbi:C45 family autoproteolytic acyltransferase/hydrolase [Pseudoduganella sp. UC29_106]|uniref:C45 family autoproteolytic acyltransferase/hydolase n=1 Tax=Pseudoduganella sp. UC29_106 TaxID=3374553 RepID=UPI0037575F35
MQNNEGFPLVEVSGTPFERGVQHGRAVPDRVRGSIALYRDQLAKRGIDLETIATLARNFIPNIVAFDPTYFEEMQGMAEGAGVAVEDIITVNCRTEMMFGHSALKQAREALDDGCTGLVVLPKGTRDGRLIHAHNWDWREACVDTGIVLKVKKHGDGPDMLMFTEAGTLGRHGFNSAGLSLSGNFLTCERDYQRSADVPLGLLRRKMLESTNMTAAMRTVFGARRYCSNNLMLAHADGEAVNLECAPDEIFWITPEDNILVHANHWISYPARAKLVDLGLLNTPDSIYRQRRVASMLQEAQGKITWETVKEALADEFGKPEGVLTHPAKASFNSVYCTVATTLMDPAAGKMWVARKPYEGRNFVEYTL